MPLRVSIFNETGHEGTVALGDSGRYVSVEEPREIDVARRSAAKTKARKAPACACIRAFTKPRCATKFRRPMIESMIRTFSFDVDLQRRVRAGDSFEVLYAGRRGRGPTPTSCSPPSPSATSRAATIASRRPTTASSITTTRPARARRSFSFVNRWPAAPSAQASAPRKHPILGYVRMHTGVDWAEDTGTPVFAAGNGTVIKAEWDRGGYGRRIEVQHLNGYVTAYSHLSGFARGIQPGAKVRQGQVSATSATPASRPARTCTTKCRSTAISSTRCASSCRAAASSKGAFSRNSSANAPGSTASSSAALRCRASRRIKPSSACKKCHGRACHARADEPGSGQVSGARTFRTNHLDSSGTAVRPKRDRRAKPGDDVG